VVDGDVVREVEAPQIVDVETSPEPARPSEEEAARPARRKPRAAKSAKDTKGAKETKEPKEARAAKEKKTVAKPRGGRKKVAVGAEA